MLPRDWDKPRTLEVWACLADLPALKSLTLVKYVVTPQVFGWWHPTALPPHALAPRGLTQLCFRESCTSPVWLRALFLQLPLLERLSLIETGAGNIVRRNEKGNLVGLGSSLTSLHIERSPFSVAALPPAVSLRELVLHPVNSPPCLYASEVARLSCMTQLSNLTFIGLLSWPALQPLYGLLLLRLRVVDCKLNGGQDMLADLNVRGIFTGLQRLDIG